jgi:CMP-N-acetylneuraminic acid synthetase
MIVALILGRGGSVGLPGKNVMPLLGRPLMSYPLMAVKNSKYCDKVYLSTDDDDIRRVGENFGVVNIERPNYLATKEALAEDAYIHGYNEIKKILGKEPEFLILLFCNGATVLSDQIDQAVEILRSDDSLDSACTVSSYNMWSPLRAKKIDNNGRLVSFIPPDFFSDNVSCDRGSQGDTWYADCSMFVVRPHCMLKKNGDIPFTWIGRNVHPIKQWGGLDVDYGWQVPIVEYWLREHGFTEDKTPYES